jgi:CxxC-x17-CxxC domain-containing protein
MLIFTSVKDLRDVLKPEGVDKIVAVGAAKASLEDVEKLSSSEREEYLFRLGAENMPQKELLGIIQNFAKVYSFSPDNVSKSSNEPVPTLAEMEAKLVEEKKITDVIREALTGEAFSETPVIKTLAEAQAFAEKIKRESLQQKLDADLKIRIQLVRRASGLDGKRPERDTVEVVCADCGATALVPVTLDLSRPVYCRTCLPKHRPAKNRPGT